MAKTPWWHWVAVLAIIPVLGLMAIAKKAEMEEYSRRRGCISNQSTVDKCVGVWESMNVELPADRDLWLDLGCNGTIARVSPDLGHDGDAFWCPEQGKPAAGSAVHYRWMSRPDPIAALGGRTRGAVCLRHGESAPSGDPAARHAW